MNASKVRCGLPWIQRPAAIPKTMAVVNFFAQCLVSAVLGGGTALAESTVSRPNVLFIAVDDLNDWVGCLGGHPQAKTPNIDKLARNGVLFEQAHCAAPLCSPSRTAITTGLRPSTTGIYDNLNWFRDLPEYKHWVTLPQCFRKHGYLAWREGVGSLFRSSDRQRTATVTTKNTPDPFLPFQALRQPFPRPETQSDHESTPDDVRSFYR